MQGVWVFIVAIGPLWVWQTCLETLLLFCAAGTLWGRRLRQWEMCFVGGPACIYTAASIFALAVSETAVPAYALVMDKADDFLMLFSGFLISLYMFAKLIFWVPPSSDYVKGD